MDGCGHGKQTNGQPSSPYKSGSTSLSSLQLPLAPQLETGVSEAPPLQDEIFYWVALVQISCR